MNIQKREIVVAIILSIVTCGIYSIYWMYKITEEVDAYSGDNSTQPGTAILLTIVTCGIYMFYWMYKMGKLTFTAKQRYGMMGNDNSVLYLVLSIVGLSLVSLCLIQNEINEITDFLNNQQFNQPYNNPYNPNDPGNTGNPNF